MFAGCRQALRIHEDALAAAVHVAHVELGAVVARVELFVKVVRTVAGYPSDQNAGVVERFDAIEKPFARFTEPREHRTRVIVLLLEELHDDGILHVFEIAVRVGNGGPVLRFRDRSLRRYRWRRRETRWDRAGYGKGENAAAESEHRAIFSNDIPYRLRAQHDKGEDSCKGGSVK